MKVLTLDGMVDEGANGIPASTLDVVLNGIPVKFRTYCEVERPEFAVTAEISGLPEVLLRREAVSKDPLRGVTTGRKFYDTLCEVLSDTRFLDFLTREQSQRVVSGEVGKAVGLELYMDRRARQYLREHPDEDLPDPYPDWWIVPGREGSVQDLLDRTIYTNETMLVDSKGPQLQRLYGVVRQKIADDQNYTGTRLVLHRVEETVREHFRPHGVQNTDVKGALEKLGLDHEHSKIPLDVYIEGQFGVCAQQAITAGALLELLKKDNILEGRISYDHNHMKDDDNHLKGDEEGSQNPGHAWARLDSPTRTAWVIDPVMNFVGTIRESFQRDNAIWPYARPSDLSRLKITPERAQQFEADMKGRKERWANAEKHLAAYLSSFQ